MSTASTEETGADPAPQRLGASQVVLIVLGSVVALLGVAMLAAGGIAVWGLGQRDGSGYFSTKTQPLSTPSYALATESLDIGPDLPGGIGDFGEVRIRASSASAVFVGIARERGAALPGRGAAFRDHGLRHRSVQGHLS